MPEGLHYEEIQKFRESVDAAITTALGNLRKVETAAQARLHEANIEQQQLDAFLDELHYRLEFLSRRDDTGELPVTVTGPLSESQLDSMRRQEETLIDRKAVLQHNCAELEQVTTRLGLFIHQIERAGAWMLAPVGNGGPKSLGAGLEPDSGDQVMWAQIIMGQEAERARLAREIHDGPAQALANTVMRLQLVEQMSGSDSAQIESELDKLRVAVQDSLKDVRRFIFNLRPASLSDIGLVPTLRHYVSDYSEQHGTEVELNVPDNLALPTDQELVVFRIAQEALQNVHKHALATSVSVDLQQPRGGPLTLTITDNGQGFNPAQVRQRQPSSSGLVNMRERAATVGATLHIDSKPGVGTTVTLVMPTPKVS